MLFYYLHGFSFIPQRFESWVLSFSLFLQFCHPSRYQSPCAWPSNMAPLILDFLISSESWTANTWNCSVFKVISSIIPLSNNKLKGGMAVVFLSLFLSLVVVMEHHLGPGNGSQMMEKMAYQTEGVCRNTPSVLRPSNLREEVYVNLYNFVSRPTEIRF